MICKTSKVEIIQSIKERQQVSTRNRKNCVHILEELISPTFPNPKLFTYSKQSIPMTYAELDKTMLKFIKNQRKPCKQQKNINKRPKLGTSQVLIFGHATELVLQYVIVTRWPHRLMEQNRALRNSFKHFQSTDSQQSHQRHTPKKRIS